MGWAIDAGPKSSTASKVLTAALVLGVLMGPGIIMLMMIDKKFNLIEGHRYRFVGKVSPEMEPAVLQSASKAIELMGGEIISTHSGAGSTVITYEMTPMENKQISIGKPIVAFGDQSLTVIDVQEV